MAIHLRTVAKHTWRTILQVSLLMFVVVVVVLGVLLGTEGGRINIVQKGVSIVRLWTDLNIEINGIRSPSLSNLKVGQLSIDNLPNVADLTLRDIDIQWQWRYAVQNRWWFSSISASTVQVELAPAQASDERADNAGLSAIYNLWPNIPALRIERLHVDSVILEQPRYPTFNAELDGQAEINWGALPARFLLGLNEVSTGNNFALQLSAEAISELRLQGAFLAQPSTAWAAWLNWQLAEPAQASWNVQIDYSRPGYLSVDVEHWAMPWRSHIINGQGQFVYNTIKQRLNFSPLNFKLDGQPATLDGWLQAQSSELHVAIDSWALAPFSELMGVGDIDGLASLDANWLGGWRRPRLDGHIQASGSWNTQPFQLSMVSVADTSKLRITEGDFTLANNDVTLTGLVDWITEEVDFKVTGKVQSDPFFRPLMPSTLVELSAVVDIDGSLSGPIASPRAQLKTSARGLWRQDAVQVEGELDWNQGKLTIDNAFIDSPFLKTKASMQLDTASSDWRSNLTIAQWHSDTLNRLGIQFPVAFNAMAAGELQLNGKGSEFNTQGNLTLTGEWQDWPLTAQVNITELDGQHIKLAASQVNLGEQKTRVQGSVIWAEKNLNLTLEHQDFPLSALPPWLSFWPEILSSFDGQWTGRTELTGQWFQPKIKTDSQLVGEWFGEPLSLVMVINPQTATRWDIEKLDAQWLGGQWQYQGEFEPYQLQLNGRARVADLNVNQIPLLSREFTGNERRLPDTFNVLAKADVSLRGALTSPELSGLVTVEGLLEQLPFTMAANVGYLNTNYVDLKEASGHWGEGYWQIDGLYDWSLNQVAMTVETDTPNARHLVPWLQLALAQSPNFTWLNGWDGSLQGKLQFDNRTNDWLIDGDLTSTGELYEDNYRLRWQGNGRLGQNLAHEIKGEWGVSSVTASLTSDATELDGQIDVKWLSYEQMRRISPAVPDILEGLVSANIRVNGPLLNPDFSANIESVGQLLTASPNRFNAFVDVAGNREKWSIDRTLFEVPRGLSVTVAGEGAGLTGEVILEGLLPDTTYWIANSEIGPGEAAFKLTAAGNLLQPELNGNIEWRASAWPVSILGNVKTLDNQYQFNTTLFSQQKTRLKAQLSSPIIALSEWSTQWRTQPMAMSVTLNSPLSVLDPFFIDQPDIQITGDVAGQFALSGSLSDPLWEGDIRWENGTFEHAEYGAYLEKIEFVLTAEQTRWRMNAKADDGRNGALTVAGGVQFVPDGSNILNHEIAMAVDFANAHLLNQAKMDAAATGKVNLTGSYHDLFVAGRLNISPLNMQSDTFLWDGAPQLNIVSADVTEQGLLPTRPIYWPDGNWGVSLLVNNRANLYGQGITAELTGELSLNENLYQPVIAGRFELVRGTYVGLGRTFQLKSGSVQIQNNQLVLDIQGVHDARMQIDNLNQIVPIQLRITGTQDSLALTLSSETGLDQDELLAQLLFGKIVSDLDVIQAFQLASVVNKLRTGDTGFDFIGLTRESFALDSLVVDTETGEDGALQLNVSAGKYINDYLYLEIEQDVGAEQEFRGSVQFKVTPNTNLELYTQGAGGEFDRNGIELNWSWDY